MIGRREPVERIERLLAVARQGRAGAIVIVGDAGVGKTSLLDHVDAGAEGFQRLRVRGVESETALDHAGLLQLVTPVRHHLDAVPAPQRRALEAAVGWGPPEIAEDRYLVAAGTLSLLAVAAETMPVLVMVDDLHWLDVGSATAVLFAARRIAYDAVAILFATRHGSPPGTAIDGLERLTLNGLSTSDASGLLPGTAPNVVARLVTATRGNPLALIETATRLTPAQRRGAAALPDPLPAGYRLEAVYEPVVASLSAAGRYAVMLAAASRDNAVEPVIAALRRLHDPEVALGDAERRSVLVREPGVVRFRHPLLRTAAWAAATPLERRAAHAALAAVMPDSRRRARIWHLAEAATGPDGTLAADLEALANEDRDRFGHAAASAALERAARLSDEPTMAAERLAAAIEDAAMSGDVGRARGLAEQLLDSDADSRARGRALAALGTLEQYAGSVPRARRLLEQAAGQTEGQLRVRVLFELGQTCFRLNDFAGLANAAEQATALVDDADPHQRVLSQFLTGVVAVGGADPDEGRRALAGAVELMESEPELKDDLRYLTPALMACGWIPLTPELVERIERRLALARDRGALGILVAALALSAHGRAWLGDYQAAFADAGEAAELAEELGYVADAAPALELLASQHAARGVHEEARAELDRATRLVQQAGTASVAAHLGLARAFCALCRDDLDEVIAVLEARLEVDDGRGAMGEVLGVAPLLIEAYVALGRHDDATSLTDRFAAVTAPDLRTQALIARCHALTTNDDSAAVTAFETALAAHSAAPDPFEHARTELMLGARLRRSGQRIAARTHLRRARDHFATMDLTLWAQRATAELASTGETARSRRHTGDEPLTSQETRVAILVGQGLTNREVAAALFVSPKTVEHHLSNVYRKRGLRSRSELARAIATNVTTT